MAFLLLFSAFEPIASSTGPPQPPVDTTTLYVGRSGWGPTDADPVYAYDTYSYELIFNVYDTLISYGAQVTHGSEPTWTVYEPYYSFLPSLAVAVPDRQETVMTFPNAGINPNDPTGYWFNVNPIWYHIEGWVDNNPDGTLGPCDVLYIGEYTANGIPIQEATTVRTWHVLAFNPDQVTVHHYYYNFVIRTQPVITFYDNTLTPVGTLGADDVVHSLRRGLVQDQDGSPMWMYYEPLFDQTDATDFTNAGTPDGAWMLAHLIDDAIIDLGNDTVQINVGIAFPDIAFKQILAQTWSSILDKDWTMARTLWNGDLFQDFYPPYNIPDWYTNVLKRNEPLDVVASINYAGTGPYVASVVNQVNSLVVLQRNPNYWKGWPAPHRKAYLDFIDIEYISSWNTRKEAFTACQLDICDVPRSYREQLLDQYGDPVNPEIKTIRNIVPQLSLQSVFFTFNVNPVSPYVGSGAYPTGIPLNFFNSVNIRRAFAYAFNHTQYLNEAWKGEALCRETPDIYGLVPDYYTKGPDPPWTYDINFANAMAELTTAGVWSTGFTLDITYPNGNEEAKIACQMIQNFFQQLSTYNGRTDPPFIVNVVAVTNTYTLFRNHMLPICILSWIADYADSDNFKRAFMHSEGYFASAQNYTAANLWDITTGLRTGLTKDQLIDLAVKTPDGPSRAAMYADLDDIYITDCPSYPIAQPKVRNWIKRWVKGWYYNALYPSDYYYHLYKEYSCWADITGPTPGIPDGICNMRDINYIAIHFGAKAPDPGRPYDPKWAPGNYPGCDLYGDRIVNMRDIAFACQHFGHTSAP